MIDPSVRLADYRQQQDKLALIALMDCYAQDEAGGGQGLSSFVRENLAAALASIEGAFTVLAFVEHKAVGLINCFESFSTFRCKPLVNIHDVIVVDEFRGTGVSLKMLEKVESIAKDRGCCKLTLEVLEGNAKAKRAYEKFGFGAYQLKPEMGNAVFLEKDIGAV